MSDSSLISRRQLLAAGLGAGAGLVGGKLDALQQPCATKTPAQTEGPFFPAVQHADEDVDLTVIQGRSGRAQGEVVYVRGRVVDTQCHPVADALVEVWQANAAGRYEHERDAQNPRPLDPNFQGWARIRTGGDGRFAFKTIKPGSYPADNQGWLRPPHIHFKVSRRGFHELTTQMYFDGEALNEPDRIRRALSPDDQGKVTVAFASASDNESGAKVGTFDITVTAVS